MLGQVRFLSREHLLMFPRRGSPLAGDNDGPVPDPFWALPLELLWFMVTVSAKQKVNKFKLFIK